MSRTPQDYAIEHAEYMAQAAEELFQAISARDTLVLRREESDGVDDDDVHDANCDVGKGMSRVRSCIYEFRKRRDRAATRSTASDAAQRWRPVPLGMPEAGDVVLLLQDGSEILFAVRRDPATMHGARPIVGLPTDATHWKVGALEAQPHTAETPQPIAPDVAAELERCDWTPEEALRWYAAGRHYDTVPNGDGTSSARILDNGAVASNALKAISRQYAELKGDVALLEAPQATQEPMFWVRLCRDGLYEGPVHHKSVAGKMLRDEKPDAWTPLYTHPAPQAAHAVANGWREALEFYARGQHFHLSDENAWDTVSGEPTNFWCDEAGTATVEDGTVAKMALAGTPLEEETEFLAATPSALTLPELSVAARDVLAERQRQISVEGWTQEHDDEHVEGQLAGAAACYAIAGITHWAKDYCIRTLWPWSPEWWKPTDRRRNLVKSGALIFAEIEHLDRFEKGGTA